MRIRIALFSTLISGLFLDSSSGQNPAHKQPSELSGYERAWAADWRTQMEKQFVLLTEAYQLDAAGQDKLRAELEARLAQEWEYEKAANAEMQTLQIEFEKAGSDENSPEAKRLLARGLELWTSDPLHERIVAQAFEATLPPNTASEGRLRLEELWYRRDRVQAVQDEEIEYEGGIKKALSGTAIVLKAARTPADNPMPHREDLKAHAAPPAINAPAIEAVRQPSTPEPPPDARVERKAGGIPRDQMISKDGGSEEKVQSRSQATDPSPPIHDVSPKPTKPASPPTVASGKPAPAFVQHNADKRSAAATPDVDKRTSLPPAPELDEWDKYVDLTARKYGFDDSQRTKGQAVLRDLRKRAEQYRASRSSDYVGARQTTDARARAETLKKLNLPIDALFDELKQRLDSLATAQQKAKAKAPETSKKG